MLYLLCMCCSDVDAGLLEGCMHTHACQPVDLLLRTSGEVRLSDFLLWQSSHSLLSFIGVLWPDFARWDLYAAVVYYQRHCKTLKVWFTFTMPMLHWQIEILRE